jgi:hypothetical protein
MVGSYANHPQKHSESIGAYTRYAQYRMLIVEGHLHGKPLEVNYERMDGKGTTGESIPW